MKEPKKLLTELKLTLYETKKILSSINYNPEDNKSMGDKKSMENKKTEWSIYQSLKKLGMTDDSNNKTN